MIKINKPFSFSEIGRKDNQEDYIYPSIADENTRVFILCDGMGGHDNGEVASSTVANVLGSYLTDLSKKNIEIDKEIFEIGLSKAYSELDKIDSGSPKKPGTTMTCVCINENNCLVAHIGDSRIYLIRPSECNPKTGRSGIKFQTEDHSLVNDLLRAGELTPQEALDFPHKNVITRAMQPNEERRSKADIDVLTDIKSGDYFFICCDGVLEQLTDEKLGEILANPKLNDKQKLQAIKDVCDGKTRDNFTCWLIPINKVKIKKIRNSESPSTDAEMTIVAESDDSKLLIPHKTNIWNEGNAKKRNSLKVWICSLSLILIAFLIFEYIYFGNKSDEASESEVLDNGNIPCDEDIVVEYDYRDDFPNIETESQDPHPNPKPDTQTTKEKSKSPSTTPDPSKDKSNNTSEKEKINQIEEALKKSNYLEKDNMKGAKKPDEENKDKDIKDKTQKDKTNEDKSTIDPTKGGQV